MASFQGRDVVVQETRFAIVRTAESGYEERLSAVTETAAAAWQSAALWCGRRPALTTFHRRLTTDH